MIHCTVLFKLFATESHGHNRPLSTSPPGGGGDRTKPDAEGEDAYAVEHPLARSLGHRALCAGRRRQGADVAGSGRQAAAPRVLDRDGLLLGRVALSPGKGPAPVVSL